MASGIYGIGISALNAAQVGMTTAEHNIANANTPGFSRQEVVVGTRPAQLTGAGFLGQGSDVTTVRRVYNEFLSGQVLGEQGQAAQLNTYYAQIQQIDNVLADPNAGLSSAIQDFFGAVNDVSNAPQSQPARQAMLGSANFLVTRFKSLDQRLTDINNSVNSQIRNSVTVVNSYANQIAALNGNIMKLQASSGQPPNDLLDQRDQLILQLNVEIKATVVKQADGYYNVFVGNGQSLVVGTQAFTLAVQQSPSDQGKLDVAYNNFNGTQSPLQQGALQGGNLGGFLAFRDQTLAASQNSLGRVAMGIAGAFNQQHRLGQDLNGVLGGSFFAQPVPLVSGNTANTGTAVVSATVSSAADAAALTGSDYVLKFNGGTSYTLTRLSDNLVTNYAAGLPATPVDGFTLASTAGAVAGDAYLIRPTANGARDIGVAVTDPAKIAAGAPIRTAATLANTGTGKISAGSVNLTPVTVNPAHTSTDLNLQQPVTITFTTPATFTVTGAVPAVVGAQAYASGADISYNGWTMQITGVPAANDTFTIGSNTNATSDSRNALLLAGLQVQNTLGAPSGGIPTTTFLGAYAQLVSDVGNKTRELQVTSMAQTSMAVESVKTQQSFSGVNLDEEAANLLRYQRAYQAAGKAIQIANSMFDTILNLGK